MFLPEVCTVPRTLPVSDGWVEAQPDLGLGRAEERVYSRRSDASPLETTSQMAGFLSPAVAKPAEPSPSTPHAMLTPQRPNARGTMSSGHLWPRFGAALEALSIAVRFEALRVDGRAADGIPAEIRSCFAEI